MDKIIEVHTSWKGRKISVDFYDPTTDDKSILGQVEIRLPQSDEPYIAHEDQLGRNLLPLHFCDNRESIAALASLPDEVYSRLSDPRQVFVKDKFGHITPEYTVVTPYGMS